jgi:hypothetical protein
VTDTTEHTSTKIGAIGCGHQHDLASHIVGGSSNQSCCGESNARKADRLVSPDRDCCQTLCFEEPAEGRCVGGEI